MPFTLGIANLPGNKLCRENYVLMEGDTLPVCPVASFVRPSVCPSANLERLALFV